MNEQRFAGYQVEVKVSETKEYGEAFFKVNGGGDLADSEREFRNELDEYLRTRQTKPPQRMPIFAVACFVVAALIVGAAWLIWLAQR